MSLYTETQQLVLGILPYFSAPWSILGSGLIIYFILKERKKLQSVYHRLMLGLSVVDLLFSTGMVVLTPWSVPEGTPYVVGARGTVTTCAVSGFFINLFYGTMFYSLFLALYFLLHIRFEWKTRRISRLEPFAHFCSISFPVITGALAVAKGWFNPLITLPGFCGLSDYPPGCSTNPNVECLRGEDYNQTVSAAVIFGIWIAIIICMILIVSKVCMTERRSRRFERSESTLVRTKATVTQALLYIFIFCIVFGPIAVLLLMRTKIHPSRRGVILTFAILTKLVSPMQGFFNAFVYFRNKIKRRASSTSSRTLLRSSATPRAAQDKSDDLQESSNLSAVAEP